MAAPFKTERKATEIESTSIGKNINSKAPAVAISRDSKPKAVTFAP
jgi:hypothetical protein